MYCDDHWLYSIVGMRLFGIQMIAAFFAAVVIETTIFCQPRITS